MRKQIRFFVLLSILVFAIFFSGCRTNPVTGKKQFTIVNTDKEIAIGNRYHPNITFRYGGKFKDADLKNYLETIVFRLHACSHRSDMPLDLTILNTSMINAFAIPGHVYCTRGFLAEMDNEAQFAAIMGHELGHITALHSAKKLTNNMLLTVGTTIGAVALNDIRGGQLMLTAGALGAKALGLSYSREQERQADRLGAYYMALAGWNPKEAIAAQKKLNSLSENQSSLFANYLSTHPEYENRIKEIKEVIKEKKLLKRGLIQGNGVFKKRWQRRLSFLYKAEKAYKYYDEGEKKLQEGNPEVALKKANTAIKKCSDQAPFYRLKGDSFLKLENLSKAEKAYFKALDLYPNYIFANVGLGEIALKNNNYSEAEKQFRVALNEYPSSIQGMWGLGRSLYKQQKYRGAIQPLKKVVNTLGNKKPRARYMLAVCYQKTGQLKPALNNYMATSISKFNSETQNLIKKRIINIKSKLKKQSERQSDN